MSRYSVEQGGVIIFDEEIDSFSVKDFPAELRDRPKDGEPPRTLRINEEVIGVQSSLADEEASL